MTGVDLVAQQDLEASTAVIIFSELPSADYDFFELIGTCRSTYTGDTTFAYRDPLILRFGVSDSIISVNNKYEWSEVSVGNNTTTWQGDGERASSGGTRTSYMRVGCIPDDDAVSGGTELYRGSTVRIRLSGLASGQYPVVQSTISFAGGRNPAPADNLRDGQSITVGRFVDSDAITDLELRTVSGSNFYSATNEASFILLGYKGSL